MAKGIPPVPPAGRSNKGPGAAPELDEHGKVRPTDDPHHTEGNLAEKGHQGNIRQNTKHTGYQQDR